jgi:hypothetical protein
LGYQGDRRFLLKRLRTISLSFYVDAPPEDALRLLSLHNQQMLLEKREDSNFKEQSHWVNKMGEDRVG